MTDPLAEDELSRYDTGRKHGIQQTLELPALEDVALELVLLRAAYAQIVVELARRERTIEAYRELLELPPRTQ